MVTQKTKQCVYACRYLPCRDDKRAFTAKGRDLDSRLLTAFALQIKAHPDVALSAIVDAGRFPCFSLAQSPGDFS